MRIGARATGRIRDADHLQQVPCIAQRIAPRLATVQVHRLGDLHANGQRRVEGRHRLLEDHGDAIAANGPDVAVAHLDQVAALEQDFAGDDLAGRVGNQPEDRQCRHTLARARFAYHRHGFASVDVERHVVHRRHDTAIGTKARGQATHLQQGFGHDAVLRSRGSSSAPGRSRCVHRSATGARRRRGPRPRSSSPTATRRGRHTGSAAR